MFEGFGYVMEIGKKIGIDRRVFILVKHLNLNGLAEVHGSRFINIDDQGVRDSNLMVRLNKGLGTINQTRDLDTVAHVLSFKNNLPDSLYPFFAAGY